MKRVPEIKHSLVTYEHLVMEFGMMLALIDELLELNPNDAMGAGIRKYTQAKYDAFQDKANACRHILEELGDKDGP